MAGISRKRTLPACTRTGEATAGKEPPWSCDSSSSFGLESKTEESGLRNPLRISTLRHCQVDSIHLNPRSSINSCVFFRPEEYGVPSIIVDDVRALESCPIHFRLEQERFGFAFPYLRIQVTVDGHMKRLPTVGALRFELNGQLFSSEAPLHEGRYESILSSSAIGAFSAAEP